MCSYAVYNKEIGEQQQITFIYMYIYKMYLYINIIFIHIYMNC